jgi:hypothetical protein
VADLRTPIFASVARAQASFEPAPGDALIIGARQAYVTASGPSGAALHFDDGMTETQPMEAPWPRAASLRLREPGDPSPSFIDTAWALAKSNSVPAGMRATQLAKMSARAPTPEQAAEVRAWSVALANGKTPVRTA